MKNRFNIGMLTLAVPGLLLLTGCETVEDYSFTYRLWDNRDLCKWSEPAPNSNLALFRATNGADVLVQYDAISEKHSSVKRRAYFLQENEARIAAGRKPEFVHGVAVDAMKPIVVLPTRSGITNLPHEPPEYAIVTREGRGFSLYLPPEPEASFGLPVYPETSGTLTRIVLTPLAVAGDTVMVGAFTAVVGFFAWLSMGAPH